MSWYEPRIWPADPSARGGPDPLRYRVFIPSLLAKSAFRLGGRVAAAASSAERAVTALNRETPRFANVAVLAHRLLRAESVASSRLAGLELSERGLARAEADRPHARDETARSILRNVAAMELATAPGARAPRLGLKDMLDIHRRLTPEGGKLRKMQTWIGGEAYSPGRAAFVPPPPEHVTGLMGDLVAFMNRTALRPIVQAAVAHAQFETIHPFPDGNGRVGRAIIHLVLSRRGLSPRYVPPVSLVLARDPRAYIEGLTAFREGRIEDWVLLFARAVERAATKALELTSRLAYMQMEWRVRAGLPRRHSAAEALIVQLVAQPIVTVGTAAEFLDRSKQAVNEAVALLATAGILRPVTLATRNRVWEARDVIDLINDFERELATRVDGTSYAANSSC